MVLQTELDDKTEQVTMLESQMVELQLQLTQLTADSDDVCKNVCSSMDSWSHKQIHALQYISEIREIHKLLEERTEQVTQVETAIVELQQEIETLQLQGEQLTNELAAARASNADTSRLDALQAELTSTREKLSIAEAAIATHASIVEDTRQASERKLQDAQADRDMLRKLYDEASAHAQRLAQENAALETRAALAEQQRDTGVALVRATFTAQVEAARAEAERWKGMHEVLSKRDTRTDDEVRRRAALTPQLQEEVGRLRRELVAAQEEAERLTRIVAGMPTAPFAEVALGADAGEDEDEDADFVPNFEGGGSSSSSTSTSSSSASASGSSRAGDSPSPAAVEGLDDLNLPLFFPEDESDDEELHVCQHISSGKMCNDAFPTAQVSTHVSCFPTFHTLKPDFRV